MKYIDKKQMFVQEFYWKLEKDFQKSLTKMKKFDRLKGKKKKAFDTYIREYKEGLHKNGCNYEEISGVMPNSEIVSKMIMLRKEYDQKDREKQIEINRSLAELMEGKGNNIIFKNLVDFFYYDTVRENEIYYTQDENIAIQLCNQEKNIITLILNTTKVIDENQIIIGKKRYKIYYTEFVKTEKIYCIGMIGEQEGSDRLFEIKMFFDQLSIASEGVITE